MIEKKERPMLKMLRKASQDRQKEWDAESKVDLVFFGCELAGEVGEACNVIKKLERQRLGLPGSRASVDDLAEELADVVIVADLIAAKFNIDLEVAIARKFNKTSDKLGLATKFSNVA